MRTYVRKISMENHSPSGNGIKPVKIEMSDGTYHYLRIEDLLNILKYWIKGEEEKYPREAGFQGRWMLHKEIQNLFDHYDPKKEDQTKL